MRVDVARRREKCRRNDALFSGADANSVVVMVLETLSEC